MKMVFRFLFLIFCLFFSMSNPDYVFSSDVSHTLELVLGGSDDAFGMSTATQSGKQICPAHSQKMANDKDKKKKKTAESQQPRLVPPTSRVTYHRLDPFDPRYSWMDEQIEQDFLPFSDGITREMLDQTQVLSHLYWRYRVENSQVFGPDGPVKQMLLKLIDLYSLPDVEFLYLEHDGFIKDGFTPHQPASLAHKEFSPEAFPGPVLTSAKHKDCHRAILFHDWYFFVDGKDPSNWPILCKTIESYSKQMPWKSKLPIVFWRGNPNGYQHPYNPANWKKSPRGQACYLSHLYPNLINAGFCVDNQDFILAARNQEGIEIYKPRADYGEHMKYKYQLTIDGHTCTYPGLQWRLLSNCTVFLQETKNIMWFSSKLVPWVHYVPIKEDLSDLVEKTIWAQNHDKKCHQIARQGQQLARKSLMPDTICLYCYKVLLKYASLQRF